MIITSLALLAILPTPAQIDVPSEHPGLGFSFRVYEPWRLREISGDHSVLIAVVETSAGSHGFISQLSGKAKDEQRKAESELFEGQERALKSLDSSGLRGRSESRTWTDSEGRAIRLWLLDRDAVIIDPEIRARREARRKKSQYVLAANLYMSLFGKTETFRGTADIATEGITKEVDAFVKMMESARTREGRR